MTITKEEIRTLFYKLLNEYNVNGVDEFDEFIMCICGTRSLTELKNLSTDTVSLPIALSVEFGDDTLTYYRVFEVYSPDVVDTNEEALNNVRNIILKKRNINKLMDKL